jgi:hypothetical protein
VDVSALRNAFSVRSAWEVAYFALGGFSAHSGYGCGSDSRYIGEMAMVIFLAGVAATFGLSTLGILLLIWRAPLLEERRGPAHTDSLSPSRFSRKRPRSTTAAA